MVKDIICLIKGRNLFNSHKFLFGPKIFRLDWTNVIQFKQIFLNQRGSFNQIFLLSWELSWGWVSGIQCHPEPVSPYSGTQGGSPFGTVEVIGWLDWLWTGSRDAPTCETLRCGWASWIQCHPEPVFPYSGTQGGSPFVTVEVIGWLEWLWTGYRDTSTRGVESYPDDPTWWLSMSRIQCHPNRAPRLRGVGVDPFSSSPRVVGLRRYTFRRYQVSVYIDRNSILLHDLFKSLSDDKLKIIFFSVHYV